MKKLLFTFSLLLVSSAFISAQTWLVTGNLNTLSTDFLGNKDAKDLRFKTNNSTRMTISSSGYIGMGATPVSSTRLYSAFSLPAALGLGQVYSASRGNLNSTNSSANGYLGVYYQQSSQSGFGTATLPTALNYMGVLGVQEQSNSFGAGVVGWNKNNAVGGTHYGVYGVANGNNTGTIYGVNDKNIGLYGSASNNATNIGVYGNAAGSTNWAGYFNGRVYSAEKMGIGTDAPTSMLTINSPTGTNLLSIRANSITKLFLDEDGKLGLGDSSPSSTLDISAPVSTSPLSVKIDGITRMYMNTSGKLGVGTSSPAARLHVKSTVDGTAVEISNLASTSSAIYGMELSAVNLSTGMSVGSYTATSGQGVNRAIEASATNGTLNYGVYSNAAAGSGDAYGVYGKATGGTSSNNVYGVYGTSTGSANHWAGYFAGTTYAATMRIGTEDAGSGYKLSVGGKVVCEEVKVALEGNWPDYVFSKKYSLMPLADLKSHLSTSKHLPGIPSADQISKEGGYNLGEMQVKLLEKVEELTLYVIQLNEANENMKKEIARLQKQ
jgi:hypothetical protein